MKLEIVEKLEVHVKVKNSSRYRWRSRKAEGIGELSGSRRGYGCKPFLLRARGLKVQVRGEAEDQDRKGQDTH